VCAAFQILKLLVSHNIDTPIYVFHLALALSVFKTNNKPPWLATCRFHEERPLRLDMASSMLTRAPAPWQHLGSREESFDDRLNRTILFVSKKTPEWRSDSAKQFAHLI
jgi:hypothetical protein